MLTARFRKQQVLQQAAELVGRDELAARLHVSKGLLESWLRGDASAPDSTLLKLAAELVKLAEPKK